MEKARTIRPPDSFYQQQFEAPVVQVDVSRLYYTAATAGAVALASVGANVFLYLKVRRNREHLEAVREYMNRLINKTSCGQEAYDTFYEDDTIDWSDQSSYEKAPR